MQTNRSVDCRIPLHQKTENILSTPARYNLVMNKYGLDGPRHEPSTLAAIGNINLTDNYFDVDVSLRYRCPLDQ